MNLRYVDLRYVDLRYVDLRYSDTINLIAMMSSQKFPSRQYLHLATKQNNHWSGSNLPFS